MNCRNCGRHLSITFVDLEAAPPSNSFLSQQELSQPEVYYPLKALVCESCFLVQVDEIKKTEHIFNQDYVYFSSFSKSWLAHAKSYTQKMIQRLKLNAESFVVEVASNDGYLLQYFKENKIPCLGIEPTQSTAMVAREKGIETLEKFFSEKCAQEIAREFKKADLIIGNNVVAHVPNVHDFVDGFRVLLKEDGVVTLEFPHLLELIENRQFDTIYHEHFSYLSFTVICKIFEKHEMRVFDVEQLKTHGGSLRVFACLKDALHKEERNVKDIKDLEQSKGMNELNFYKDFQKKSEKIKLAFLSFLLEQKKNNTRVAAYGAAAKGNTLLNFAGVRSDLIPFVVDVSPHKQGKFLPGSRIPVLAPEALKKFEPNYVIIFPWNIKEEIVAQLRSELKSSKFVIFFPQFEIID